MAKRKFDPVHPGVVLAEDFLKGLEISQYRLAKGISVSPRRINEIVQGTRAKWIYTEINEDPLYEGCALLPELAGWLAPRGFRMVEKKLWGAQLREGPGRWFGWGDALFIRA